MRSVITDPYVIEASRTESIELQAVDLSGRPYVEVTITDAAEDPITIALTPLQAIAFGEAMRDSALTVTRAVPQGDKEKP